MTDANSVTALLRSANASASSAAATWEAIGSRIVRRRLVMLQRCAGCASRCNMRRMTELSQTPNVPGAAGARASDRFVGVAQKAILAACNDASQFRTTPFEKRARSLTGHQGCMGTLSLDAISQ